MSEDLFSVIGTIQRIASHGGLGGAIFFVEPHNSVFGNVIKVKLNVNVQSITPAIGEVWDISGSYENESSYGRQIIAEKALPVLPKGDVLVEFIGRNPKFAGIGIRTAQKMWMAFGEELYDILTQKNEELLLSKIDLNDTLLEILFNTWSKYQEVIAVVRFFHEIEFNAKLAHKAVDFWGKETVEKIKEDPYRLLAFGNWVRVDAAAKKKLNITNDADIRLIAAVEEALYRAYYSKHTAQDYQSLLKRITQLLGHTQSAERAIELALEDGRVQEFEDANSDRLYQLAGVKAMERYIQERITKMSEGKNHQVSILKSPYFDKHLAEFEASLPYRLTDEQRQAIKMVAEQSFSVILGGVGVGKTTVLRGVYYMLPENAIIIQVAFTSRTASDMSISTGQDAMSIAELLRKASEESLPENAYFFIDESSTLDVPTFYRICKALPSGSSLCLIGDQHQLPPIGPGLVLHQLVKEGYPHITELVKVHSKSNKTSIPIIAEAIKKMTSPDLDLFVSGESKGFGVSICPVSDESLLLDAVLTVYRELDYAGEAQIVAARVETCLMINHALHIENKAYREYRKQVTNSLFTNDVELCEGDKITYKDNIDSARRLSNGSLGVITHIYKNPLAKANKFGEISVAVAEAEFDSAGVIQLTEEDLAFIDLGYAITAHKSQGNQWERVVIVSEFVEKLSLVVDNTWFYTAITRCKKQAVIVGSRANFVHQIVRTSRAFSPFTGLRFKKTEGGLVCED